MATLIDHLELNTGIDPKGTVIWMHGLGADCWDFVPIVKELDLPPELPLRFIFPQAPSRPVTINNGYVMPAWYDISMDDIARKPDETGIRDSQRAIDALIDREVGRGMRSDKIVIAGFSQGGAIALQTALRSKHELAGILALSTYLTLDQSLAAERSEVNRNIPILMGHGTQDPVVPLQLAEQSKAALEAHGYRVEWHTWPMPHAVCAEEVEAIGAWLRARFTSRILIG
ncbi:MAG TPA: alpha/beta fold hydrolase [Usitatibacteraceae bacterium]|nr:alpha/beta fold hydrolase [Usitatibacteraceae bacterium]